MDGARARSESESGRNPKKFGYSVTPVASEPNLEASEKIKHVEFEDTLEEQSLNSSRNGNKLTRNRYMKLILSYWWKIVN